MSFRGAPEPERYHSIDLQRPDEKRRSSEDSNAPLSPRPTNDQPKFPTPPVHMPTQEPSRYPPEPRVQHASFTKLPDASPNTPEQRPTPSRSSSWDLLGGVQRDWEAFDSRNASEAHLQFADGDMPKNKAAKMYNFLLNTSIVTRWIIFIVPVLALLWIPGILSLTAEHNATIWHVRLLWWSVWFSIIWGGWWAALAFAMLLPLLLRYTLGLAAVSLRKYFEWLTALRRPVAFVAWSIAVWVSFNPVINDRLSDSDASKFPSSKSSLTLVGRLAFGLMLCAIILLGEKFSIQWVAYKFHQRSYADRIAKQKAQLQCLITLYRNSTDIPNRRDTLKDPQHTRGLSTTLNPSRILKGVLKGVRRTAATTTTAFGNMASEIAGASVLQPNSPAAIVSETLSSANKTRMLARRLFYSFRSPEADRIVLGDISRFFSTRELATYAFEIFDRDENGDATRDEIEAALLEMHTERMSLAASMKDVDSATGRLDNILISLYSLVVLLIFAIMLDAGVSSIVTGAGTFVLGLSWLIGGSAQEIITSCVFLLIKHPFDISDAIEIDGVSYMVKEMRLLSTVLVDGRGCDVQCPNIVLNTKYILNKRRSGAMSETFEFTVAYNTTFEQIEELRSRMLTFVKVERRDYFPVFDIFVVDIPDQANMHLKVDIKYKSNWQMGAVKAQRRNKWMCALKNALLACKMYGPTGDPNPPPPPPKQVTLVPYENVQANFSFPEPQAPTPMNRTNYAFTDSRAAMVDTGMENIFDDELRSVPGMTPAMTPAVGGRTALPGEHSVRGNGARSGTATAAGTPPEEIKMRSAPRRM